MAVYSSLGEILALHNLSLSLAHYQFEHGRRRRLAYHSNITMALCTALIGSVLIFTGAYLMEKTKGQKGLNLALRMLSFVPMAVPGWCSAWATCSFNLNGNPLHALRHHDVAGGVHHCSLFDHARNNKPFSPALRQLGADSETAALSLKAPLYRHYLRVTVPICLPALLDIVRYLFVSAMTTVSAAIFLYSPDTILAAVAVLNMKRTTRRQRQRCGGHVDPDPVHLGGRVLAAGVGLTRLVAPL